MDRLPQDVWVGIFLEIPLLAIPSVRQTCRAFASLIQQPSFWALRYRRDFGSIPELAHQLPQAPSLGQPLCSWVTLYKEARHYAEYDTLEADFKKCIRSCSGNHWLTVRLLMPIYEQVDTSDSPYHHYLKGPLARACAGDAIDCFKILLDEFNVPTFYRVPHSFEYFSSCLQLAAVWGARKICTYLILERGFDVNGKNIHGCTCADSAILNQQFLCARWLRYQHGAIINLEDCLPHQYKLTWTAS